MLKWPSVCHICFLESGAVELYFYSLMMVTDCWCAVCLCVCVWCLLTSGKKRKKTMSPLLLLLLLLLLLSPSLASFVPALSLPAHPLNRLAGSWGDWKKRPGVSTLSLWFGPTGRDSRYLPAPRRSHHQVWHPLITPDPSSSSTTVHFFFFFFCMLLQEASLCQVLSSHFMLLTACSFQHIGN